MRLIDLSQPLFHDCPNCPDHPPVRIDVIGSHENPKPGEETWHMELINMASHTGSHVDAPLLIVGQVDDAHGPFPELTNHFVPAELHLTAVSDCGLHFNL